MRSTSWKSLNSIIYSLSFTGSKKFNFTVFYIVADIWYYKYQRNNMQSWFLKAQNHIFTLSVKQNFAIHVFFLLLKLNQTYG